MRLMKTALMGIATAVMAALLLTVGVPKTAHAVVAALVQVANTTTAPALTLDVAKSASQHVELVCNSDVVLGLPRNCSALPGGGEPYVVPAGQNLVVTPIDAFATKATGSSSCFFFVPSVGIAVFRPLVVPNDGLTHVFPYPSGIVFPAGYTFNSTNFTFTGNAELFLDGFLTSN